MPTDVVIPKLGMTMKEGTIVEWAVADGARVERDQVVFVLSTDKLDTDVTAEVSGTLHHRAGMRETHPVGTVVAVILADWGGPARGSRERLAHTRRLVALRATPRRASSTSSSRTCAAPDLGAASSPRT